MRPTRSYRTDRTPFRVLQDSFDVFTTPPNALAIDGTDIEGLPDRPVPLDELRARLLHPSTPYATRDAALDVLVRRAQADSGSHWMVGLGGVLLPGLRRAASSLVRACPSKARDIEAEILAGFVAAVRSATPGRDRPAARLTWAARRSAEHLVRAELAERGRPASHPMSAAPPRPWGHPDLVLFDAVLAGVIGAEDAELIGATRLGEMSLCQAAAASGLAYDTAKHRRTRAERVLVAWIRGDFVPEPGADPGSKGVGRPRQGVGSTGGRGCANSPRPNPQPGGDEAHRRAAPAPGPHHTDMGGGKP